MNLLEKVSEILYILEGKIEIGVISLKSGQSFEVNGGNIVKNLQGDGKNWYIFETFSKEKPKVKGAIKKDSFNYGGGSNLTTWYIPLESIKNKKVKVRVY